MFAALGFCDLEVPVAQFAPGELVEGFVGLGELVVVEVGIDLTADFFQAVEDPAVGVGEFFARR